MDRRNFLALSGAAVVQAAVPWIRQTSERRKLIDCNPRTPGVMTLAEKVNTADKI